MRRDTRHHHVVRRGNDNFVQKGAFRGRAKIARGCQTNPRDGKLNRSTHRKVCDEIRDIIMSDVAETTILCKGAHSEGARRSLEGAKNGLEGAQKVLEVQNRTIRTFSFVFLRFPTTRCLWCISPNFRTLPDKTLDGVKQTREMGS